MRLKDIILQFLFSLALLGCHLDFLKKEDSEYVKRMKEAIDVIQSRSTLEQPSKSYFIGSPNFSLRKPNYVIIHHTAETDYKQAINILTNPQSEVSCHYLILKDGTVIHMVSDYVRSWHAGTGKWGSLSDLNSCSIGVELDNNGYEPFPNSQIEALLHLLGVLNKTYNIPKTNVLAHSDISYKKSDPNSYFPWQRLAESRFGIWYSNQLDPPSKNFDPKIYLKIIGYDTSDLNAAIVAFKRHFIQTNVSHILNDKEKAILENIGKKILSQ